MVNEKKLPKKLPKFVPKEKDKTVVDIVKTITAVPSVSSVSVASFVSCPRCGEVTGFVNVKGSDFKCSRCGSGYSGFPPPKKE